MKDIRINYIFCKEDTWEKLMTACDELGWSRAGIVRNCLSAFFRKEWEFYANCALRDAEHRGMDESDYYRTLRDGSEDELDRYKKGRPGFPPTPIDIIPPVPAVEEYKRRYNVIQISPYYLVLLRVAKIVDGGTMIQLVSRIVEKHLQDYWESSYLPQIEKDRDFRFK